MVLPVLIALHVRRGGVGFTKHWLFIIAVPPSSAWPFGHRHQKRPRPQRLEVERARSLSSRMRHLVVGFSERPPLWEAC